MATEINIFDLLFSRLTEAKKESVSMKIMPIEMTHIEKQRNFKTMGCGVRNGKCKICGTNEKV